MRCKPVVCAEWAAVCHKVTTGFYPSKCLYVLEAASGKPGHTREDDVIHADQKVLIRDTDYKVQEYTFVAHT
jgi:hypothetical protein